MNNEIFFGRNSIRFWFYRFTDSPYAGIFFQVIAIVVCILLVINFLIPQYEQWFSIRSEVIATQERLATENANINYMNRLDRNELNRQTAIATNVLPYEKDFSGILNALNLASVHSGVNFEDYSFHVGQLSSTGLSQKGFTIVPVTVDINGNMQQVATFLYQMANSAPLSEVTSVEGTAGLVEVSFNFYQKSLPKTNLPNDEPLPGTVLTNTILLNKISAWQDALPLPQVQISTEAATSSAVPLF